MFSGLFALLKEYLSSDEDHTLLSFILDSADYVFDFFAQFFSFIFDRIVQFSLTQFSYYFGKIAQTLVSFFSSSSDSFVSNGKYFIDSLFSGLTYKSFLGTNFIYFFVGILLFCFSLKLFFRLINLLIDLFFRLL